MLLLLFLSAVLKAKRSILLLILYAQAIFSL
jgi:hypothetical protein